MSNTVIRVEKLSKKYVLGYRASDGGLRHRLQDAATAPFRWLNQGVRRWSAQNGPATASLSLARGAGREEFWALRDLNFEIKRGEVVGIIGRNGAGKSTLLKILSRITEPTEGRIRMKGRVASLLEVGTGFHPELTGRENIYLNGAILGMGRHETSAKFDEIVAFAEIEQFLDTPVKRYSSGMYVRLAFAVAAHLDPEILIVDEVLAVGDAQFQKKCLGKMEDVASRKGRTVLFVSHNMGAIQALCQRGICLSRGKIIADTTVAKAVDVYLEGINQTAAPDLLSVRERSGKGDVRLVRVEIQTSDGSASSTLITGKFVRFVFHLSHDVPKLGLNFLLYDTRGNSIAIFNSDNPGPNDRIDSSLEKKLICDIESVPLLPGRYRMQVNVSSNVEHQDGVEFAAVFDVEEGYFDGRRETATPYATVAIPHSWTRPN